MPGSLHFVGTGTHEGGYPFLPLGQKIEGGQGTEIEGSLKLTAPNSSYFLIFLTSELFDFTLKF